MASIIVIGAGILQIPLIRTIEKMGLTPILFDGSSDAPGMQLGFKGCIASTQDPAACARVASELEERSQVKGVITAGTDASRAVAAVAYELKLPGISKESALAASDKIIMRQRLKKAGVAVPDFCQIQDSEDILYAAKEMGFPLVLKPASSMGARGVILIRNRDEVRPAMGHVRPYSRDNRYILEKYMEGPELSVDALVFQKKKWITGIADRLITGAPYFIETGHNMPSSMPGDVLKEVEQIMFRAMDALGIDHGAGKGDIKVTPEGVMIGEVAARLSGGYMSSHTYPLSSGVDLLKAAVEISMGISPESLTRTKKLVSIERAILGPTGKVLNISGLEEAGKINGLAHIHLNVQVGDLLPVPASNVDKAGNVIVVGSDLQSAQSIARQVLQCIQIDTDESYTYTDEEIRKQAASRFSAEVCRVCDSCDGVRCSSSVPGMGGVGRMNLFRKNVEQLASISIVPCYLVSEKKIETSISFLGKRISFPIMNAPMTGVQTNLKGVIGEFEFSRIITEAALSMDSVPWLGDGATADRYREVLDAMSAGGGGGVFITKPRSDDEEILKRLRYAEKAGALAVGIDVDSISLPTMRDRVSLIKRSGHELRKIRESTQLPFILKGILSSRDVEEAIKAGVDCVVLSNHGGRVSDHLPTVLDVIDEITTQWGDRVVILADGGIRSGEDAYKVMKLGARGVLVGRPFLIYAVGGGRAGVKFLYRKFFQEYSDIARITGVSPTKGDES